MKKLKLGISALAIMVASTAFSQTTTNPWLIGVGAHAENHVASNGTKKAFEDLTGKALWSMNNYEVTPPLSKLTVARNINKFLVADLQASVGNVGNKKLGMGEQFFLMAGLGLQFKINGFWNEESWFDPYLRVGANYLRHDYTSWNPAAKKNHFALSTGVGSNFWFTNHFGIGVQGDYVSTPGSDLNGTYQNFWQASASLLFRFGNTDKDGDGVKDKDDKCPEVAGPVENQGCPWGDADNDGVLDNVDKCVNEAGPAENQGCPWPDTDGDGVLDKDDKCVNEAGPAENQGCPWPDRDGDGVLDKDDKCPDVPGTAEYNGCPPTAQRVTKALKDILFDFDKATIRSSSVGKVDAAAEIIKNAKAENFVLVGMTDKKGSAAYNLKLSEKRAAAVKNALIARGVNKDRLKSIGIGEQKAVVSEKASNAERQKDRKVIVRAVSDKAEWESYK